MTSQSTVCWGSVVGCVHRVEVLFLAMSGISAHCMLGSVVGCVQGLGSGSEQLNYVSSSVVGCVHGVGVLFLAMSGISEHVY